MKASYQLYSSRNFGPLADTLKMLSELGYDQVEGYGALITDTAGVAGLAEAVSGAGLQMPSAHVGLDMVEAHPDTVITNAKVLGLSHVFVPFLDEADRPVSASGWRDLGARIEMAGQPLVAAGLGYGWHNHDFEFTALPDGSMPIEALFEGGASLSLEFDVAWCARAGQDPFYWIDRLKSRIAAAHIKDIAADGQNEDEDGWSDVGKGVLDWAGLMSALHKTGCELFIVEHDNPSDDRRFASSSLSYLNNL